MHIYIPVYRMSDVLRYIIIVLDRLLYIDHIVLAIEPFFGSKDKVDSLRWDFEGKETPAQMSQRLRANFTKRRNEVVGVQANSWR